MSRNRPHTFRYIYSKDAIERQYERDYFGGINNIIVIRQAFWIARTVILHYSNGTNKCSIEGCDAPIDALTLEHERFNREEVNKLLGIKSISSGVTVYKALMNKRFPDDLGLTIKCMFHNMQNQHPEHASRTRQAKLQNRDHIPLDYERRCTICKETKNQIYFNLNRTRKDQLCTTCIMCDSKRIKQFNHSIQIKAYAILGYTGDPTGMSFSHIYGDGHLHRKDIADRYNLQSIKITGITFAFYIIKDYEAGLPMWPGLIVEHMNIATARDRIRNRLSMYDKYGIILDPLDEERMKQLNSGIYTY